MIGHNASSDILRPMRRAHSVGSRLDPKVLVAQSRVGDAIGPACADDVALLQEQPLETRGMLQILRPPFRPAGRRRPARISDTSTDNGRGSHAMSPIAPPLRTFARLDDAACGTSAWRAFPRSSRTDHGLMIRKRRTTASSAHSPTGAEDTIATTGPVGSRSRLASIRPVAPRQ